MPAELIPDGQRKAQQVRSIIETKAHFVWPTPMEDFCDVTGFGNLGTQKCAEMTALLGEVGVLCYPSPLPSRKERSVVLMLKNSGFARGFEPEADIKLGELHESKPGKASPNPFCSHYPISL